MDFLFFSKLLPLFIYPLGLTCVLLIITLFFAWKRPRLVALPVSLALIIILVASNGWVSNFLVKSLEWQNLPPQEIPEAEAIVLLGGATKSVISPRILPDLNEQGDRVLYAAKLYKDQKAPLIIAAGGRIDWKSGGQPESTDMAQLLEFMGIPKSAIIEEPESLNTYENAVNVRKILAARHINTVLLVTSALHMPRSLRIFQRQSIQAIAAPTDFLVSEQDLQEPNSSTQATILNILPDSDRLDKTTKALKEYIGIVIYWLKGWL